MSLQTLCENIAVRQLALRPFWTINMNGKIPMDFKYYRLTDKTLGATGDMSLVPMQEIIDYFMTKCKPPVIPQQFVYSLDCKRDGVVILDIEAKCPDDIKQDLIQNLPYCYGDISMSGNGAHLMFPCPPLDDITSNKVVMKEEHGWYEILLCHYCSFTLNTLPKKDFKDQTAFLQLWNDLAAKQTVSVKDDFDITANRPDFDFPEYTSFYANIKARFKSRFLKTIDDYNGDYSRYEFAVLGSLKFALQSMQDFPFYSHLNLDLNQKVWIVYEIATEVLEYRPKHDEYRDNMPWLLYSAYNAFARQKKEG